MTATIVCDDVLHWAETYKGEPFHAALMDPPYHLISDTRNGSMRNPGTGPYGRYTVSTKGFMGTDWDGGDIAFRPETWAALARHLLPGAFVMAFASSRGYHRLACAMEDAGLLIHPSIFNYRSGETLEVPSLMGWSQGAGFPKATKIDVAIDRAAGAEREVIGYKRAAIGLPGCSVPEEQKHIAIEQPATPLAQAWAGHRYGGQMLKPALEPAIVAQVPYAGRPVDSITETGAGALWIDGTRLPTNAEVLQGGTGTNGKHPGWDRPWMHDEQEREGYRSVAGRWPANLALCHTSACERIGTRPVQGTNIPGPGARPVGYSGCEGSPAFIQNYAAPDGTETVPAWACAEGCPVASLDAQAGERSSGERSPSPRLQEDGWGMSGGMSVSDTGSASRFFFTADWSLDVAEQLAHADPVRYCPKASAAERHAGTGGRNHHSCIKPLSLCTWLATLLLPPAAYAPRRLLVPFCGTGSEIVGGIRAGWEIVLGIEQDPAYVEMGRKRITWWTGMRPQTPTPPPREEPGVPRAASQAQLSLL